MGLIEIILIVLLIAIVFGMFVPGHALHIPGGIIGVILLVVLLWLLLGD